MAETTSKQRDNRIAIRLVALYDIGRMGASGRLANISYSGALIEDITMEPKIGTRVVLYVYLKPPSALEATAVFELTGNVVRHTPTGFAIEYDDNLDPDVRRMVDDAAALVAAPR